MSSLKWILPLACFLLAVFALVMPTCGCGDAKKAKAALARSEVGPTSTLTQAIDMFRQDVGRWPASLQDLSERPKDAYAAGKWDGPYLRNFCQDPWGRSYRYRAGGAARHNEDRFDLWSAGPDGVDGTDDDIVNWPRNN